MTDITIPPAALEAGARAAYEEWRRQFSTGDDFARYEDWDDLSRFHKDEYREQARTAFLAILEAWPEMRISWLASNDGAIVLPLPQEASDDQ